MVNGTFIQIWMVDGWPGSMRSGAYLHGVLAAGLQQGRALRWLKGGVAASITLSKAAAHPGAVLCLLITSNRSLSVHIVPQQHCMYARLTAARARMDVQQLIAVAPAHHQ